jgi:hypothetical protein
MLCNGSEVLPNWRPSSVVIGGREWASEQAHTTARQYGLRADTNAGSASVISGRLKVVGGDGPTIVDVRMTRAGTQPLLPQLMYVAAAEGLLAIARGLFHLVPTWQASPRTRPHTTGLAGDTLCSCTTCPLQRWCKLGGR